MRNFIISIGLIFFSYTAVFAKDVALNESNNYEHVVPLIKGELTPILLTADLTLNVNPINSAIIAIAPPIGTITYTTTEGGLVDATQFCLPDLEGISWPNTPVGTITLTGAGAYSYVRTSDGTGGLNLNNISGKISHNSSDPGIYLVTRAYVDGSYETATITVNSKPVATLTASNQTIYSGQSTTITGVVTFDLPNIPYSITVLETYGAITRSYTVTGTTTTITSTLRGTYGTDIFSVSVSPTNTIISTTNPVHTFVLTDISTTSSSTCSGTYSGTASITVNALPSASITEPSPMTVYADANGN